MNVTYFKRFRMEIDLYEPPPAPVLPEGFYFVGWNESLVDLHAEVKFQSFHDELDSTVFPSLATRQGCHCLMNEISRRSGFVPQATWLAACAEGNCGTVQGVSDGTGIGGIQNLGVMPAYRGRGIGSALLLQALHGFRRAGLARAFLEVTAQNGAAIRLYRRLGFRCRKTVYKAVDASCFQLLEMPQY
jgi:ribosomal protein S18 acetylase RimI-like enzyme